MVPTPISLAGHTLHLDPVGALIWPEAGALIVADLHLEKGSAAARRGHLVPPWDSQATLKKLAALLTRHAPRIVIALGDSFHDTHGPSRLAAPDRQHLASLTATTRFIWVQGNHDPAPPAGVAGDATPEWHHAGLTFRHIPTAGAAAEIAGHLHPKARVATRAGEVARPCFITDGRKMILPAFGAYTGGLDIRAPAIAGHFPDGGHAWLLGTNRVFGFPLPW
jgi:DNA ligase-associated metallophosphoesterase